MIKNNSGLEFHSYICSLAEKGVEGRKGDKPIPVKGDKGVEGRKGDKPIPVEGDKPIPVKGDKPIPVKGVKGDKGNQGEIGNQGDKGFEGTLYKGVISNEWIGTRKTKDEVRTFCSNL